MTILMMFKMPISIRYWQRVVRLFAEEASWHEIVSSKVCETRNIHNLCRELKRYEHVPDRNKTCSYTAKPIGFHMDCGNRYMHFNVVQRVPVARRSMLVRLPAPELCNRMTLDRDATLKMSLTKVAESLGGRFRALVGF